MPTSVKQMLAAANAAVPRLSRAEAEALIAKGEALVVVVRDSAELAASGKVAGALHVTRGLLEFKADPESPSYEPALRPERRIILYCGSGGRSALAAKTLHDMGYGDVASLAGGYAAWRKAQED